MKNSTWAFSNETLRKFPKEVFKEFVQEEAKKILQVLLEGVSIEKNN